MSQQSKYSRTQIKNRAYRFGYKEGIKVGRSQDWYDGYMKGYKKVISTYSHLLLIIGMYLIVSLLVIIY